MALRTPRTRNIFLFVVDALRADHLPAYGYTRPVTPFLSQFLQTANPQKVDIALSNGLDTITGLQCLLTSKGVMDTSPFDYTLPDYLTNEGFKADLILAGDHSWQLAHKAFGKHLGLFYDGSEHPGAEGACDDQLVINEVQSLPVDDGSYHFFYIHLILVHQLAVLKEPYFRYSPTLNIVNLFFKASLSPSEIQDMTNMYDDRILQIDDTLKKIMDSFREKGYLKDYIAVLTGDHGQLIGEHQHEDHSYFADFEGMHIPMIFFGSKPLPKLAQYCFGVQIDLAPTLVDMAGLEIPSTWRGQSLLKPRTNIWSFHTSCMQQVGQEMAIVHYDPKEIVVYSRRLDGKNDPGRLYDVEADPQEKNDLIDHVDRNFLDQLRSQSDQRVESEKDQ